MIIISCRNQDIAIQKSNLTPQKHVNFTQQGCFTDQRIYQILFLIISILNKIVKEIQPLHN